MSGPTSFPPPADGWLRQPDDPGIPSFLEASDRGVDGHAPIGEAEGHTDAEPPMSRLALGASAVFWLLIGWIVWGVVGG